jgi:endonuclease G
MTTAKNKKTPARKRSSAKKKSGPASGFSRFLKFSSSAVVAALASFQIASCSFNPHWSIGQMGAAALFAIHIPALEGLRKFGWPADPGHAQRPQAGRPAGNGSASAGHHPASPPAASQATRFANCPQFFPGGRAPALQAQPQQRELCFSGFAVLHSGLTKTPVFVAERLNRQLLLQGQGLHRTDKFYADARLPRMERSELDDYKRSGFSRGHMAPAADMASPEAMAQSFSLANMVPQNQEHNAGVWSKVEQDTRKYAMRARGDVFVFTGPVFSGPAQTIGANQVHVPDYLFKLVYDAATGRSWVYWQANSADTRMGPPISYEEFTRRTGMPLLSNVRLPHA